MAPCMHCKNHSHGKPTVLKAVLSREHHDQAIASTATRRRALPGSCWPNCARTQQQRCGRTGYTLYDAA